MQNPCCFPPIITKPHTLRVKKADKFLHKEWVCFNLTWRAPITSCILQDDCFILVAIVHFHFLYVSKRWHTTFRCQTHCPIFAFSLGQVCCLTAHTNMVTVGSRKYLCGHPEASQTRLPQSLESILNKEPHECFINQVSCSTCIMQEENKITNSAHLAFLNMAKLQIKYTHRTKDIVCSADLFSCSGFWHRWRFLLPFPISISMNFPLKNIRFLILFLLILFLLSEAKQISTLNSCSTHFSLVSHPRMLKRNLCFSFKMLIAISN